jgi:hypothetical protein
LIRTLLFRQKTASLEQKAVKKVNWLEANGGLNLKIENVGRVHVFAIIALLLSSICIGAFTVNSLESTDMLGELKEPIETLTVEEPIEIVKYPASLTLFPGETNEFNVTIRNLSSVSYSVTLEFRLNDTEYQRKYVSFSSQTYMIDPGQADLPASLTVSKDAPSCSLLLTVNVSREADQGSLETESPQSNPPLQTSPLPENNPPAEDDETPEAKPPQEEEQAPTVPGLPDFSGLSPSYTLLGAGARWASEEGKSALYVNWYDNWVNHHSSDGADWEWGSVSTMQGYRSGVGAALEAYGFSVTFAGDIPSVLEDYDLVVLFAYFATEPRHASLIGNYVEGGGSVVLICGTPCHFMVYSKTMTTFPNALYPPDFSPLLWLGAGSYRNGGGEAKLLVDSPFGTGLARSDVLLVGSLSCGSMTQLDSDAKPLAVWGQPLQSWVTETLVFAYTFEYGAGRLYYQAIAVP